MCLMYGMSVPHSSNRPGLGFCLAEAMPEETIALRELQHGHISVRPNLPPPCPGQSSGSVFYHGRRIYGHSSGNSDYSDYYYEMYSPPSVDYRQLKSLSRGQFKLRIAYIVLTLFVVLSIVAFILMNPSVSPFLSKDPPIRSVCRKCKLLEGGCGEISILKDLAKDAKPDTCCFTDTWHIIRLILECKKNADKGATTTPKQGK